MSLIKKIKDKKVNFEFNKEYIKVVTSKIANNDAQFITNSFNEMHPADAADIIEHLGQNDRESLIKLNNFNIDPEVFIELNESVQSEIIAYLSPDTIVRLLKNLESDDAITILENVDEKDKNTILSSLPPKDRFALLESLSYPEDTAARIMQREFTAVPSNWSVGQTIDYLRENNDLPEEFLEIFIIDEGFKPIGTVPSSKVLRTSRETKMSLIMDDSIFLIPVDMDREEVGHSFENYNLISAGVVNKDNKLVGVITADVDCKKSFTLSKGVVVLTVSAIGGVINPTQSLRAVAILNTLLANTVFPFVSSSVKSKFTSCVSESASKSNA